MHNYMQLKLYSKYMIISITKYLNVKWPGKHGHFIFLFFFPLVAKIISYLF